MGNVHASTFGFPSPPLMPDPSVLPSDTNETPSPLPNLKDLYPDNPGTGEDLHKKCKDIFPTNFEGGKFMLNKPLTNHFQVSHSMNFPTSQAPGYKFGATYVGTKQVSDSEAFPVLLGEIDPSGNLNANIIHQFYPCLRTKFVTQIAQGTWQAVQGTADFKWNTGTLSLTGANIDLYARSGVVVGHVLQKVSPSFDAGAEIAYQYGPQIPCGGIAIPSALARYTGKNCTAAASFGASGLHATYYQKSSDSLQIGVEMEANMRMQESTATMAYQVDIPKANFCFKGTFDSNWTVGCVLEKKLAPLPFTFTLSLMHNHSKYQSKVGAGFIIG